MEGIIVNFRSARHHQYPNQMIVQVKEISDREKAKELVGKKVTWTSPAGKELQQDQSDLHISGLLL